MPAPTRVALGILYLKWVLLRTADVSLVSSPFVFLPLRPVVFAAEQEGRKGRQKGVKKEKNECEGEGDGNSESLLPSFLPKRQGRGENARRQRRKLARWGMRGRR